MGVAGAAVVTIHSTHPFADANPDPARRFRGRLGGQVTLWTAGEGATRAGLTVTSLMIANGEPPRVLALLDPDAEFTEEFEDGGRAVVQLLSWRHRDLADMFAGTAPAPGGMFAQAEFTVTPWGPLLSGAGGWAGVRLESTADVGWSRLVTCTLDEVTLPDATDAPDDRGGAGSGDRPGQTNAGNDAPLLHRRGRYRRG